MSRSRGLSDAFTKFEDKPKSDDDSTPTIRQATENIRNRYIAKSQKPTVEETHTRSTFLFRNDLQERLNKLAEGKRGFKTFFLNEAIETLLDVYEEQAEKD